ncbi:MAG: efflux RND transporter periplasmic adaptor subunit [Candidatus Rickettsia vulgarisii]
MHEILDCKNHICSIIKDQKYRKYIIAITIVIALAIGFLLKHHIDKRKEISLKDFTLKWQRPKLKIFQYIDALGTVTSKNTVNIKTQINGQLTNILFINGQFVKKGDVLAEIDARPYKAQLIQNEGQLEHDLALLENSKIDLKRYQSLAKDNSVSKQILDTQYALVKQYEGNVKTDKGIIENTKLNIAYCTITAPFDGLIGIAPISSIGSYLQTSDTTPIAVLNSIDPISIIFSITENNLPEVMEKFKKKGSLTVQAYDHQQKKLIATGKLIAIDSQIDTTQG